MRSANVKLQKISAQLQVVVGRWSRWWPGLQDRNQLLPALASRWTGLVDVELYGVPFWLGFWKNKYRWKKKKQSVVHRSKRKLYYIYICDYICVIWTISKRFTFSRFPGHKSWVCFLGSRGSGTDGGLGSKYSRGPRSVTFLWRISFLGWVDPEYSQEQRSRVLILFLARAFKTWDRKSMEILSCKDVKTCQK